MLDVDRIRDDFPILRRKINGEPLIYFDSAATSQKPRQVIEAISDFYSHHNANIHRGIHTLAEEATELYEGVRKKVAKFINSKSEKEIIFVRNTTEAVNLIAYAYGRVYLDEGEEVVTTIMEHHSNFVPWQRLALENGAVFKVIDIDSEGRVGLGDTYKGARMKYKGILDAISKKTKIVALTHVSNVLGIINPIKTIISVIRDTYPEILIVVDGAQAVPHIPVDVSDLDCDFYAFSGHKMLGPTGVGVLWGREKILSQMPPFLFGGGMIKEVNLDGTTFADPPRKFEAGTPDVAAVVGLGAAIDYLETISWKDIQEHERLLTKLLTDQLTKLPEVTVYGPRDIKNRIGVVSFTIKGIHPHDIAQFLNDKYAVAIRSGHHCAMPLHKRLGVPATARASLYLYNTEGEIEIFINAIKELIKVFK